LSEVLAQGRYRVERMLGQGGMAVVYLAHDEELSRRVAVKVLAENVAGDVDVRRRFLREARLAGRLAHPNVVRVYDAGETGGRPFIVMEYVPGRTLADCEKLAPDEVVRLGLQACAGLQHAHDAGLVHRDVKPGNLLLRDDGVLKVTDFGIAHAAETTRITQLGTVLGTAAYLSPEQAAGEDVGAAADIYSLAAVLYELLTGQTPYAFTSLADLVTQQRRGVITPVRELEPTVSRSLEAAVMHALAHEPRFRPESADSFAAELGRTAEPETIKTRVYPRAPRSRTWLWIALAAGVAIAAVIVGLLSSRGGGKAPQRPSVVRVPTPAHGATAAAEARNLSAWLRARSR
jgi:serine/threonine-protein kinase